MEVAVLIGDFLGAGISVATAMETVVGYGVGLDLTLRDVQDGLKKKGLPWERAKAFPRSCPMSPIVPAALVTDSTAIDFGLTVNGVLKQDGNSGSMIHTIADLIVHIADCFTLSPGDLVLTGTPAGVAPLAVGDRLVLTLGSAYRFETLVQ